MFGAGRVMGESDRKCRHCGAPLPTDGSGDGFCCNGCRYVYELIRQEGLDHYYALRDRPVPPVGMEAFEDRDYADLEAAWLSADTSEGGIASMDMRLRGISCVGCVWLVEKLFSRYPGALRIDIDPQRGTVRILADRTAFPLVPFVSELQRFGYSLIPIDDSLAEGSKPDGDGRLGRRIGVCSFLAMNTMMAVLPSYFGMSPDDPLAPTLRLLAAVLASFSAAYGGGYFFLRAWNALKAGTLHMDLPIALGLIVAWVGSMFGWAVGRPDLFYFDFVAVFTVLMLVGRWFQEWVTETRPNLLGRWRRWILVSVITVVVALAARGPLWAAFVGVGIALVGQLEGHVLQPLIMGKQVSLHPVVVGLVVTGGTLIAGILGEVLQSKYAELKLTAAERCPKQLGSLIKPAEIQFHHEVTNQYLWGMF